VVLREGGGLGETLTHLDDLEPVERELMLATRDYYTWQEFLACYDGRIAQSKGWAEAQKQWKRVDIGLLEQARIQGDLESQVEQMRAEVSLLRAVADDVMALTQWRRKQELLSWQATAGLRMRNDADEIKMVERHRRLVAVVLDRRSNAVLPWGCNHLPGVGRRLAEKGFEVTDVRWLIAHPVRSRRSLILASLGTQLRNIHKIRPTTVVRHINHIRRTIAPTAAVDPGEDAGV
jgi:hypothetical protein